MNRILISLIFLSISLQSISQNNIEWILQPVKYKGMHTKLDTDGDLFHISNINASTIVNSSGQTILQYDRSSKGVLGNGKYLYSKYNDDLTFFDIEGNQISKPKLKKLYKKEKEKKDRSSIKNRIRIAKTRFRVEKNLIEQSCEIVKTNKGIKIYNSKGDLIMEDNLFFTTNYQSKLLQNRYLYISNDNLEINYDLEENNHADISYTNLIDACDGFMILNIKGTQELYDSSFNSILPLAFKRIIVHKEAGYIFATNDKKKYKIFNLKGKQLLPQTFDKARIINNLLFLDNTGREHFEYLKDKNKLDTLDYRVNSSISKSIVEFSKEQKKGILDVSTKEVLIPPIYKQIVNKKNFTGAIKKSGVAHLFNSKYDIVNTLDSVKKIQPFCDSLMLVIFKNKTTGLFSNTGELIKSMEGSYSPYKKYLISRNDKKNGKHTFISNFLDKNTEEKYFTLESEISVAGYKKILVIKNSKKKLALMDTQGNMYSDYIFDNVNENFDDKLWVSIDENVGLLSLPYKDAEKPNVLLQYKSNKKSITSLKFDKLKDTLQAQNIIKETHESLQIDEFFLIAKIFEDQSEDSCFSVEYVLDILAKNGLIKQEDISRYIAFSENVCCLDYLVTFIQVDKLKTLLDEEKNREYFVEKLTEKFYTPQYNKADLQKKFIEKDLNLGIYLSKAFDLRKLEFKEKITSKNDFIFNVREYFSKAFGRKIHINYFKDVIEITPKWGPNMYRIRHYLGDFECFECYGEDNHICQFKNEMTWNMSHVEILNSIMSQYLKDNRNDFSIQARNLCDVINLFKNDRQEYFEKHPEPDLIECDYYIHKYKTSIVKSRHITYFREPLSDVDEHNRYYTEMLGIESFFRGIQESNFLAIKDKTKFANALKQIQITAGISKTQANLYFRKAISGIKYSYRDMLTEVDVLTINVLTISSPEGQLIALKRELQEIPQNLKQIIGDLDYTSTKEENKLVDALNLINKNLEQIDHSLYFIGRDLASRKYIILKNAHAEKLHDNFGIKLKVVSSKLW